MDNENKTTENTTTQLTLDGKPVTQEVLNEKKQQKGVRIVEASPNTYKTLSHLQG